MSDTRSSEHGDPRDIPAGTSERLVYVMPEQMMPRQSEDEIDLLELWQMVWNGKWLVIGVTFLITAISVAYALLAVEWYRAEVLLAPAEEKSAPSLGGQLGGLAALAGVSIGGGNSAEAVATLKSRDFAREFVEEHGLLTVLLAHEWDEENGRWLESDPVKQPDNRNAVRFFHEEVLRVSEDPQTSLVTLAIEWKDPEAAADWAMVLANRLNQRLRERALHDAEVNVEFLQQELAQTNVVTLQQAIGRLLESELQKLMLARGNEEFGFRVIDVADVPRDPVRPRRILIVIFGAVLGVMVGVVATLVRHMMGRRKLVPSIASAA